GATPIDFAFAIHTDVGSRCSGARVNGQLVPLRYQLRQGDTVEIITSPNARPRREWLKLCRSARARTRIKQHLRQEERTRLRSIGRSLLEQALGLRGQALGELEERGVVAEKAETFHLGRDLKGIDGLYEAAGAGLLTVEKIIDVLAPPRPEPAEARATRSETNLFTRMIRSLSGRKGEREPSAEETAKGARGLGAAAREGAPETPIQVTRAAVDSIGSGGAMIQLATCCQPIPGDPLIGHFVPNKGIIAHVESCPDALDPIGERRVYLAWEPGLELARSVTVEVRTTNTVGLLAEMSRVFSHHGVNIKQANCRTYDSGQRAINTFHATVSALDQLESLMQALQEIDGVLAVRRVFGRSSYQYERS
ncbi:MAG: bifunctional (p)ppGpp synthetase/guanosine-3',5'-bis(diphosphate) 3'-pyrophosphohydrolase, partial [Myxococcales bacterium]|nr:bifunctional (p)ppGpp synthetase/guanosine-3',5'-bis(diphosphate) 3'-pyrophosphohydrolase [Myxococcales bacterium]